MNNLIIKTNTKFMEEFQISTTCESSGNITSISPEPDNEVTFLNNGYEDFTLITTDQQSDTGFSKNALPFYGSNLCVGKAADERLILLYTRSNELYYIQEESIGSRKFSKEVPLFMPLPINTDYIHSVQIYPLLVGFAICIIVHCELNDLFYLIHGFWQEQEPLLNQMSHALSNSRGIFQGNTIENLRFTYWYSTIAGLTLSDLTLSNESCVIYSVSEKIDPILFTTAQLDEQHSCLLTYAKTEAGYKIIGVEQNLSTQVATVTITDDSETLTDLQSCVYINPYNSNQRELHVFALTTRKTLKHCRITYSKEESTYHYSTMNDLGLEQVESISFVKNNPIVLNAYISFVDHKKILRLSYGFLTSLWNEEEIMIPEETHVQSLSGYSIEFMFQDDQGIPYQNTSVSLWTNDVTRVKIDGTFHLLSLQNKMHLVTDSNGMIRLFQPTLELSSSSLVINVTSIIYL
jgi:hypothetical protein